MSYGSEGWSDYYGEGAPWMPGDGIGDMGALGAVDTIASGDPNAA